MRIGVDLGGTKIVAVALDGGRELVRLRADTPRGDYRATIDALVELVRSIQAAAGDRALAGNESSASIGIGIPGTITPPTGLVKNANSTWLIGKPLQRDLEAALGQPVRLANDANCFAISEATDGAAEGAGVVFGVIAGTGVGGGLVVNGQVLTGPNGIAGEWGHNALPWPDADEIPGPLCYCGKNGCIETFLSGPGMSADHQGRAGERLLPPEIVGRAAAGDEHAATTLQRYEDRMARALAGVVNLVDPDAIVLGGGLSNIERLYVNVPSLWGRYVFACGSSVPVRTRLVRARHGDASGVRGAAWLWP